MNGRAFDAQVVLTPPSSERGKLLSQYVCARITSMTNIDIGLFDFDRHNAIYYFILNADEDIYLRYGGRDSRAADSYLNLRSLELALRQGLQIHQEYLGGKRVSSPRPAALFPRDIPLLLEHVRAQGSCVECHLIADYQLQQRQRDGTLDKAADMFPAPDLKTLGIYLNVPQGLVLAETKKAAAAAGMQVGDRITAIRGERVWTFGDLQYRLGHVPRDATSLELTVQRADQQRDVHLSLPPRWWVTDLDYRFWSVDPRTFFGARPLPPDRKRELGLPVNGFASVVTSIDPTVRLLKRHELQIGDVVYRVDGVATDPVADTAELHIKLRKSAGDEITLSVIRDGERLELPLKTGRQRFRK